MSFLFNFLCYFVNSYNHTILCTPCTKAKATCKPFDTDKACVKTRVKVVWRSKARKTKQQTNVEWKVEVSRKLESQSELWGLRKDVQRIMVALEKLAGIEGQDSNKEQFSWPESQGEETEVLRSTEKRKQREQKTDRAEEEGEVRGQEEENRMEGIKEKSSNFSPVMYSVSTRTLQFSFLINIIVFSVGRKWMRVMINDEARIQVLDDCKKGLQRNTSVQILQQRLLLNTSVTNFIRPYLHQFFIDSHSLNGYGKPLKRPFDRYQSRLKAINNG